MLTVYKNRHRASPENKGSAMTGHLIHEGGKKKLKLIH